MKLDQQNENLANLQSKVDELEKVRHHQSDEVERLARDRNLLEDRLNETGNTAEELNRLKMTLSDVSRRQREVRHGTS